MCTHSHRQADMNISNIVHIHLFGSLVRYKLAGRNVVCCGIGPEPAVVAGAL